MRSSQRLASEHGEASLDYGEVVSLALKRHNITLGQGHPQLLQTSQQTLIYIIIIIIYSLRNVPSARILQRMVNTFICLTQLGGLSIYVLFTATSLHQLHGQYGIDIYLLILFLPVILLALIRYILLVVDIERVSPDGVYYSGTSDSWLQSLPWPPCVSSTLWRSSSTTSSEILFLLSLTDLRLRALQNFLSSSGRRSLCSRGSTWCYRWRTGLGGPPPCWGGAGSSIPPWSSWSASTSPQLSTVTSSSGLQQLQEPSHSTCPRTRAWPSHASSPSWLPSSAPTLSSSTSWSPSSCRV